MLKDSVVKYIEESSKPRDWDKLKQFLTKIIGGKINGKPYYKFFKLMNQSLEVVPQSINLSIQPVQSFIPWHVHNYTEIAVPLRGECDVSFKDSRLHLKEDDILIIGNHTVHTVGMIDEGTIIISVQIKYPAFSLQDIDLGLASTLFSILTDENQGAGKYILYRSHNEPTIQIILDDLVNEYYSHDPQREAIVHLNLLEIFARLTRLVGQSPEQLIQGKQSEFDILAVLLEIERNYTTITLQELASKFGFNPNYLSELLKQKTGLSFIKLVKLQRVNVAAKYLTLTTAPVNKIAEKVGYENPSYFFKVFKDTFGVSPAQYRKQNSKSVDFLDK